MINKIKEIFLTREFIKFLIVGCINLINGIFGAYIFSLFFNVNIAFVYGYVCSLSIAYALTSKWIFYQKLSLNKYIRFCISYVPNFIIQNICIIILYNYMSLNKLLVYSTSAMISVPITFYMIKFFTFMESVHDKEE